MFLHAGFSHTRNDITWAWLTAGDILRLAMRMGYHRDPSQYPHLSAFEGEMRRRVFQFIYQTDLLCSFQIGLTPAIRAIEYDSQPSRNFHENQLTPAMIALPPALDNSEPTYYAYFVAQSRLFRVFGDIVEHLNALEILPYSKVLVLDDRLRKAFELIPPHLRRTLPDSITDPPRVVLQRIELEVFYHKVNCVLHRRYMLVSPGKADYSFSCQSCIDSALRILTCQVTLHNNERWPHVEWWTSSFILHDFTLAGTVLCLYLAQRKEEARPTETIIKIQEALATSHALWSEVRDTSSDARQAFGILEKMRGGLDGGSIKSPDWSVLSDLTRTMGPENPQTTESVTNSSSLVDPMSGPDFGATNADSAIDWVCRSSVQVPLLFVYYGEPC